MKISIVFSLHKFCDIAAQTHLNPCQNNFKGTFLQKLIKNKSSVTNMCNCNEVVIELSNFKIAVGWVGEIEIESVWYEIILQENNIVVRVANQMSLTKSK